MSNTHDKHDRHCDHKIKYCRKCDTAYCEYNGCDAEWTNILCTLQHYPNTTWTYTTPIIGNDWTSSGSTDNGTLYASGCAHN